MPNYLIEIPHSEEPVECQRIINLFVTSGSMLLANAHWGCKDGVHKAWFMADFDNKEQAMQVVPPLLRNKAHIIELAKFNKEDMGDLSSHGK